MDKIFIKLWNVSIKYMVKKWMKSVMFFYLDC